MRIYTIKNAIDSQIASLENVYLSFTKVPGTSLQIKKHRKRIVPEKDDINRRRNFSLRFRDHGYRNFDLSIQRRTQEERNQPFCHCAEKTFHFFPARLTVTAQQARQCIAVASRTVVVGQPFWLVPQ
ncbi:hypothetical protein U1Q18_043074 [Sarracenia purpurea var. burkii]